jgi:signal transduction histidine kinase
VEVRLLAGTSELGITVSDDGRGVEPAARRDGLGLRGMEERVKEIGGTLTISSVPGRGSVLSIQLPLPTSITEAPRARVAS